MNTRALQRFAQEARKTLLDQVAARLDYVLNTDTAALRAKSATLEELRKAIKKEGREAIIDQVAYTWFNRLVALRFMDVNDYQPLGLRVLSPAEGQHSPQILQEAQAGRIAPELKVDGQLVIDHLNGQSSASNPENEAYRLLLVAACNHLHQTLPFLFESIDDYSELLLPEDLMSHLSIVQQVREGMTEEGCSHVEIIGWLYQYYVSEWNEVLIKSKKVYERDELAPASQLFTPKWIVQYMVDNTLGQKWLEIKPDSQLAEKLGYYIKPAYKAKEERRSIEDLTFFEPCVGSGHILAYAFDVFYSIYEEEGYSSSEIPGLILSKNLFGIDIDPRAAQMASLVLMMKARSKSRRFFRKGIQPNIFFYEDFEFDPEFANAKALGSALIPTPKPSSGYGASDLFAERVSRRDRLRELLTNKYDVVVTNPPYISSSRMEGSVKQYVNKHYPEAKSDLFSVFILRCLQLSKENGLTGYMTPFVWMFISSYEQLREEIIGKHFINNLVQLEYSGFDGATVPVCTFTLRNSKVEGNGSYIRLSDFKGAKNQAPKTLEAIQNPECGWFYTAQQQDFHKIPGSPIGYWVSHKQFKIFSSHDSIKDVVDSKNGMTTSNNERFLRMWFEVGISEIGFGFSNRDEAKNSSKKWFPYNKGGEFRKWYGNHYYVVNWEGDGKELWNYRPKSTVRNANYFFKPSISWSDITSSKISFRYYPKGFVFDAAVNCAFGEETDLFQILSVINNNFFQKMAKILNPTLHFKIGNFESFPLTFLSRDNRDLILSLIDRSSLDWDSREVSWNFLGNKLIGIKGHDIQNNYELYKHYWKSEFLELQRIEESLNNQFVELHGLKEEIESNVPLEEITILKEEVSIQNERLCFNEYVVLAQKVSYALGCMFGRYSLEIEGLVLANQGETLQDYLSKVGKTEEEVQFLPDEDNIIPFLDDEWFEDDVVGRFYEFLKVAFDEKHFAENLKFVEECLSKDIRSYFVKDFYKDHIKRYKKRPIYWMFQSPKGHFRVLVYLHRYTPDTLNRILNSYLREFIEKLRMREQQLLHQEQVGSAREQNQARKQLTKIREMIADCREYETEILYPLATERIAIDLDDGVLVNYNKFGRALAPVPGLNDKKTKDKVRKFDWIDTTSIV